MEIKPKGQVVEDSLPLHLFTSFSKSFLPLYIHTVFKTLKNKWKPSPQSINTKGFLYVCTCGN